MKPLTIAIVIFDDIIVSEPEILSASQIAVLVDKHASFPTFTGRLPTAGCHHAPFTKEAFP